MHAYVPNEHKTMEPLIIGHFGENINSGDLFFVNLQVQNVL